jgi:general secretion pathway protein F
MQFEVKALRGKEGVASLLLEAASAGDATRLAQNQGYSVLSAKPKNSWSGWMARRGASFPLLLFSQEVLALLDAGLPLVEALEAMTEKEHRNDSRKILAQVVARLYEGQTLSAAMEQYPEAFPTLYVATVRASEKSGALSEALTRYIGYQSQLDVVRKKLVSASIYPALLMGVGGLVTLFLMGYVVPRFSVIYESAGNDLPWLSQLLLSWGKLLANRGAEVLATAILLLGGLIYGISRPSVRRWAMARLWQIPAVGERMRIYQLARFYRTLGMLLAGGAPIVAAMERVAGLLPPLLRGQLELAATRIKEGRVISESLEHNGLTTPVAVRMLRVGERTGGMGQMMERIAAFYDEEMARWVDWFTRLFEPLLMVLIGLVIGVIVVLMYLPVFELAGSIQ